ncbi:hypothetical protein KCP77_00155 [Salmonella enterica subsp. enterica]|nr:hypothetical protein KCP77_00155 [Salmonella enterica subsp. enterica]
MENFHAKGGEIYLAGKFTYQPDSTVPFRPPYPVVDSVARLSACWRRACYHPVARHVL